MAEFNTAREARDRIRSLQAEIQSIEAQMSDPNKINPSTGRRLSAKQYTSWRKNALVALAKKMAQLRDTKAWLKSYTSDILATAIDAPKESDEDLLKACFAAHEKIRSLYGTQELGADVIAVFDVTRDRVLGI
jgi:hypothetical protein